METKITFKYTNSIIIVIHNTRLAGHVAKIEEHRSAFKILTDEPTRNRLLGRLMNRCENNIS